jgi:hypothetical protein
VYKIGERNLLFVILVGGLALTVGLCFMNGAGKTTAR